MEVAVVGLPVHVYGDVSVAQVVIAAVVMVELSVCVYGGVFVHARVVIALFVIVERDVQVEGTAVIPMTLDDDGVFENVYVVILIVEMLEHRAGVGIQTVEVLMVEAVRHGAGRVLHLDIRIELVAQ